MHRFYLPPTACQGNALELVDEEAHHALRVLRVERGERVAVLDGAGHEFHCEIAGTTRHTVQLRVLGITPLPRPAFRLTLVQAITKGRSMELIVQKATELGAARLVPVLSERAVPRLEPAEAERRVAKWRAVGIEAIKQCGSPWLPAIDAPETPARFLARHERFDLVLLASLQPGARHPREHLRDLALTSDTRPVEVAVWVGPEGDFTPAELNLILAAGALPITLGPLILRSETAALYCLSVLAYELSAPPSTG